MHIGILALTENASGPFQFASWHSQLARRANTSAVMLSGAGRTFAILTPLVAPFLVRNLVGIFPKRSGDRSSDIPREYSKNKTNDVLALSSIRLIPAADGEARADRVFA